MPYKRKEDKAAQMRVYRKRKKVESKVAERVLAEHLRIQSISDYASYLVNGPQSYDRDKLHFAEKLEVRKGFLKGVVDAVLKEYPETGPANRQRIEALVYQRYEWCKRAPEEVESSTFSSRRHYALLYNQMTEEKVKKAEEYVSVICLELPEKEQLYMRARIEHFANYMEKMKEQGYDFYVAREACGPRFFSQTDFWDREWFKPGPESMARSRYKLGPKFWAEAKKAQIDVDFIKEWRMEDQEQLKQREHYELEWAKSVYETSRNAKTYERLANLFVKQGLNDNQIMERLETAGVTAVIDPSYIRARMPEVRKEAEKRLRFDIEEKILIGILQKLSNDEIIKTVLTEFIIHKDELRELVMLIRKSMREEISTAEEKVLSKAIRIKHRIRIKLP